MVVARLQRWKGPEALCGALARLGGKQRVAWLGADHLNGAPTQRMSEHLQASYPSVWGRSLLWKGQRPPGDVAATRSSSPLAIVPSLWDTFNLAAVEALAAGQVLLISRRAGASEMIEDGVSGFLCDPTDTDGFATALDHVFGLGSREAARIGEGGRQAVARTLGDPRLVEMRLERYRALAETGPTRKDHPWLETLFSSPEQGDPWGFLEQVPLRKMVEHSLSRGMSKLLKR